MLQVFSGENNKRLLCEARDFGGIRTPVRGAGIGRAAETSLVGRSIGMRDAAADGAKYYRVLSAQVKTAVTNSGSGEDQR
jgi:hypothetical protein